MTSDRWQRPADFGLGLEEEAKGLPLFLKIARAIVRDIRRGRLLPGAHLPGSRTLAVSLGGHRNTVLAALRELDAEGWIETRRARGPFVRSDLPVMSRRLQAAGAERQPRRIGFDLPPP